MARLPALLLVAAVGLAVVGAQPPPEASRASAGGGSAMWIPRAAHTATLLAGRQVLVVGGCDRRFCETSERASRSDLFDVAGGRFLRGPRLAAPRVGHAAARLADGSVLVVGGWRDGEATASTERYDPRRRAFTAGPPLNVPRGGFTLTALGGGRLLVAGGETRNGPTATTEIYDPRARRFVRGPRMTTPRNAAAAAALGEGRVLVVGGSTVGGRVLRSAEIFDPARGRFRRAGSMSVPRHKLAAAPLPAGRVLVVGGADERDAGGRHPGAEVFDPGSERFRPAGRMRQARYKIVDAVTTLPGGDVVIAGGGTAVEVYDWRRRRFRVAAAGGGAPAFATATRVGPKQVLVLGGYDDAIVPTARARVVAIGG